MSVALFVFTRKSPAKAVEPFFTKEHSQYAESSACGGLQGGQEKKCRPLTRAKMTSCALNWLQTIILTLQNCWATVAQSSWPKKIIVCNTLGELGPFFALVRGRFFSKAFWPGGSEFHGDLFLAPPVRCLVPVPVQQYLVPSSTGSSVVVFNLRQYPYLRPVPSAVDPNRCRRDSRKMISENEPTCPQHQSAAHTHTATILALTSMFAQFFLSLDFTDWIFTGF